MRLLARFVILFLSLCSVTVTGTEKQKMINQRDKTDGRTAYLVVSRISWMTPLTCRLSAISLSDQALEDGRLVTDLPTLQLQHRSRWRCCYLWNSSTQTLRFATQPETGNILLDSGMTDFA